MMVRGKAPTAADEVASEVFLWGAEGNGSAVSNICVSAVGPGTLRRRSVPSDLGDVVLDDEGIRVCER